MKPTPEGEHGMSVDTSATAPPYAQLRPARAEAVTRAFPVYHDLEQKLAKPRAHPDPIAAHVLATCSGYAYSDAGTVAMIAARLGLDGNRCRMIAERVDAMLI